MAALLVSTISLLGLLAWLHEPSPTSSTPPPPALTPYLPEEVDEVPPHDAPQPHHADAKPARLVKPPRPEPVARDTLEQAPHINAPEVFFPEPEPPSMPLSEPLPEITGPAPEPFEQEALDRQGASLGPRDWMAQLPDSHSQEIEEIVTQSSQIVAEELDRQQQERMLYEESLHIVRGAALSCAAHDLSARARIVVHADRLSLLDAHGRLFGISATANIPAGGRAMRTCLMGALEGRHFQLALDDIVLRDVSFHIGQAR